MSRYNLRPSSRRSQSVRAGVIFPVARLANKLRRTLLGKRVTKVGGVYLTSIIEYLAGMNRQLFKVIFHSVFNSFNLGNLS